MNTPQLITYIFSHPNSENDEWVKVYGTFRREKTPHWFKPAGAGSTTILHKVSESGPEEGFAQDTMINYYRKMSWSIR